MLSHGFPILLTVHSMVSEGTLRGLAGHIDNGASRSSGLHATSHHLPTETEAVFDWAESGRHLNLN